MPDPGFRSLVIELRLEISPSLSEDAPIFRKDSEKPPKASGWPAWVQTQAAGRKLEIQPAERTSRGTP